ncbi:MAG: hypothetical protein DUD39_17040 [Coriobacteriaceae bacterium]|nr:MAG: hypothetical protein DUD39_17040 [Coriobacteriaceae bacterium]
MHVLDEHPSLPFPHTGLERPCGRSPLTRYGALIIVFLECFEGLHDLQVKLSDHMWWYNHERIHSKLSYMSPVEFREESFTIPSK